ncbi:helix-turn-helix domain-containing protein [Methylopila sp. 73B]|uniref:transposase n=1 Tax=Methylopila sp. 73B TaxID=1120792 RepID=UPI00035D3AAA|nr:helix-turn-helix domain-containing protein [Methylopila sp. 73B]
MTRHRSHSIAFKRQIAQEFISGETLHGLAKRHDLSRKLIRLWVQKFEAGAFDEDAVVLPLTLVRSGCDLSGVLSLVSEGVGRQVAQGRVGSFGVVVDPPGFDPVTGVG